jgi:hypothetical protein
MKNKAEFVVTDEVLDTMKDMDTDLYALVIDHIRDDDTAIVVASLLLKYAMSVYGGVIAKEEIEANVDYMISMYDSIEPIIPPGRRIN